MLARRVLVLLPIVLLTSAPVLPAQPPAGKKYAFLVGVKDYDHSKLRPLDYPENDVVELGKLLAADGYEVVLLTNSEGRRRSALQPTLANINARLKELLDKCKRRDTILVGLAGHGLQFEKKKPTDPDDSYFCPQDARPLADRRETLLSLSRMYRQLDDSGAGVKLLLVDACRDDPQAGRGRGVDGTTAPRPPKGVAALYSCSAGERAFESTKLKHGVFFHYVLEGLKGQAKNGRNEVTWDSLQQYVREQVPDNVERLMGEGARQTPTLNAGELSGKPPVLVRLPGRSEDLSSRDKPKDGKTVTMDLGAGVKMQLVLIPAGTFMMGSPKDEEGHGDDEEQHRVEITRPFYMGMHTVTVGQFRRFIEETKYDAGTGWKDPGFPQTDDHPVVNVSWNDATAFCDWLSKKDGKKYALPTEAQWEYSCRAGSSSKFYFGNNDQELRDYAWYSENSGSKRHPVGQKKPNAWGLFDMHGNVWQWCADWYDKNYYKNSPRQDPQGPGAGVYRMIRGGSSASGVSRCRSALRDGGAPSPGFNYGFRVVCVR